MKTALVIILAGFCPIVWAQVDLNSTGQKYVPPSVKTTVFSSEDAPIRTWKNTGDIPDGYRPGPAPLPTLGEPPRVLEITDGGEPAEPYPLWGPDIVVYSGNLRSPSPSASERMIAYDQTSSGILFAAFTVSNGETAHIYRSTNNGRNWAKWNGLVHPGYVLSSLKLIVGEGDSNFVFFFVKSSAGNGDIYVGRFGLTGGANVFPVKVDTDTITNFSATRDIENPYYLYLTYQAEDGGSSIYTLRSTDYGKTWASTSGTILDTKTAPKPDICYGRNGNVYIVCRDKRQSTTDSVSFRIKQSTNRGTTWLNSYQVGTPTVPVYDPVIGARHNRGTVWLVHVRDMTLYNNKGTGVFYYYSTDDGQSWAYGGDDGIGHMDTPNNEKLPSIACDRGTGYPTVCFALVPSDSLMFTWASGDTNWTKPIKVNDHRHTGNFPPQAGWMTDNGNFSTVLYAGVGPTGLYFDGYGMSGIEEGQISPRKPLNLFIRPTPASHHAEISFSLPRTGPARLSVLDISGRELTVLNQKEFTAGTHHLVWNCANLPPGVYLLRLDTGTGSHTCRLVVSR